MFWKFLIFIGLFKALPTLGLPAEEILQQTHVTRCLDRAQTDPRLMKRMERIEEGAEVVASAKSENNLGKASASVENSAQKDSEVCSTRKSLSRKVKQKYHNFCEARRQRKEESRKAEEEEKKLQEALQAKRERPDDSDDEIYGDESPQDGTRPVPTHAWRVFASGCGCGCRTLCFDQVITQVSITDIRAVCYYLQPAEARTCLRNPFGLANLPAPSKGYLGPRTDSDWPEPPRRKGKSSSLRKSRSARTPHQPPDGCGSSRRGGIRVDQFSRQPGRQRYLPGNLGVGVPISRGFLPGSQESNNQASGNPYSATWPGGQDASRRAAFYL
ncbi:hypothetical protein PSTT_13138, partial [Puccinia striiformis]